MQSGVEQSSRAEAQFETITDALHDATHLVALLDDQSDRIAQSSAMVHANGARVREAVDRVVVSVRENGSTLDGTRDSILTMEHVSNRMFRSEEHTSELQSLMRISYAVFCLKKQEQS